MLPLHSPQKKHTKDGYEKSLAVFNVLTLLGTLFLNSPAGGQLVAEKNVGEISDAYPTLFAPAGFTFSIWGIIYLGLLGFVVFQVRDLFSKRPLNMDFREKIGPWFVISNVFNMLWIVAWLNENIGLALVLMLGLLASLLMIYIRLGIGMKKVIPPIQWFVHIPFSIYFGWICVATIANVSAFLVDIKWNGWGLFPEMWTGLMILVAGILGSWLGYKRRDLAYRFVFLWALWGIYSKINALDFAEGKYLLWTILVAMAGVGGSMVATLIGNRKG